MVQERLPTQLFDAPQVRIGSFGWTCSRWVADFSHRYLDWDLVERLYPGNWELLRAFRRGVAC
jgi:hypothetical protein